MAPRVKKRPARPQKKQHPDMPCIIDQTQKLTAPPEQHPKEELA
jgi:hypothetical protein